MTEIKKIVICIFGLVLLCSALLVAEGAQEGADYPTRAITYVIPFNPGGQSDITAQYQKEGLQAELGVNIIIKYLPGAGGAVGWANIVQEKPDGYTICGNNIPHIIAMPLVRDNAGFETDDLVPVYMFQTTPIGLAVLKESPYDTLGEFLAYAKSHPGEITVGGSGTHSGHHIALLLLQKLSGAEFTYIPSTGAAPSVANFLGGHTAALFANSNDLVTHNDKIKILGMGMEERFEDLPNAPTFIEQGIDMTAGIDRGVCAPPGTPEDIVMKLEAAFAKVNKDPAMVKTMKDLGIVLQDLGAREYKAYIDKKKAEVSAVLKELGEI